MKIGKFLYGSLIAPRQRDEDVRNREVVLNVLLSGTLFILLFALLLLTTKIFILGANFLDAQAAILVLLTLFIGSLYNLSRRGWHRTTSFILVAFYFLLATALVFKWGIIIPTGILLYGLVIVLAGILVGSTYSLYAAASVVATLSMVQLGIEKDIIHPDWNWTNSRPGITDLIGFSLIFATIALVSWLFNHQMERSLRRAERAEAAVTKQNDLLESTVQKRTEELQTVQLEKIQQMYRFAELGQLSTALLHDLSNHLTSLTMDIEGLQGQSRSRVLSRAKRSIYYIDDMVIRVRDQLHGKSNIRPFNVLSETEEVVKMLRHRAQAYDVLLTLSLPADKKPLRSLGEPTRFRQLMANLISNGIDAHYDPRDLSERREVQVTVSGDKHNIIISVHDWGRGIPQKDRAKLFQPFFSTKQSGMGMGLYIVKQVVEEHFLGTIAIDSSADHTVFVVTIPRATS